MSEEEAGPSPDAVSGMQMIERLREIGVATDVSLDLPINTTYDELEAMGAALGYWHRNITWMLCDWLIHIEEVYPVKYSQAVEATMLSPETLKNYIRTARRVPRSRRVPGVPFSVHTEVAQLEPSEQRKWLGEAKKKGWKREELRSHLRPVKGIGTGDDHASVVGEIGSIEEMARELVRGARSYGNDYLVRRYQFTALCAALGEEPS